MLRSRVALASASALWRSCSCRSFCGTEHGTTRCFLSRCVNNWSLSLEKNVEQFLNLYILLTELKWFLMIFRLTFPQKSYKIKTLSRYICCGLVCGLIHATAWCEFCASIYLLHVTHIRLLKYIFYSSTFWHYIQLNVISLHGSNLTKLHMVTD